MPKYTDLLTRAEYEQLTADARIEYILDIAAVLKATRQTSKTGIPLREPPRSDRRICAEGQLRSAPHVLGVRAHD